MNRVHEVGVAIRRTRYAVGIWWRPRNSRFNGFEVWHVGRKGRGYLSMGVVLWRLSVEFSAIEGRSA